MYGIIIISEGGRLRVFVEGGTCAMAQWPVLACFQIYCASRGGPCDSEALVVVGMFTTNTKFPHIQNVMYFIEIFLLSALLSVAL